MLTHAYQIKLGEKSDIIYCSNKQMRYYNKLKFSNLFMCVAFIKQEDNNCDRKTLA